MSHNFLIRPAQLNEAFESSISSGSGRNSATRRTFIKRTGGATVATLVAWNMTALDARATTEDGSGSESLFLVCTLAPTEDEKNPEADTDRKVYTINNFRDTGNHLICAGPSLGDNQPAVDEAFYEITAHLLATFEQTTSGTSSGATLRECIKTQKVVYSGGDMIWRAEAVAGNLPGGSISNSGASGGIGMVKGTVNAKTKWAEPGYGGIISYVLSVAGTAVNINLSGAFGSGPMEWDAAEVQWQFEVMNQTQLDAFLLAHWDEIHNQ